MSLCQDILFSFGPKTMAIGKVNVGPNTLQPIEATYSFVANFATKNHVALASQKSPPQTSRAISTHQLWEAQVSGQGHLDLHHRDVRLRTVKNKPKWQQMATISIMFHQPENLVILDSWIIWSKVVWGRYHSPKVLAPRTFCFRVRTNFYSLQGKLPLCLKFRQKRNGNWSPDLVFFDSAA